MSRNKMYYGLGRHIPSLFFILFFQTRYLQWVDVYICFLVAYYVAL